MELINTDKIISLPTEIFKALKFARDMEMNRKYSKYRLNQIEGSYVLCPTQSGWHGHLKEPSMLGHRHPLGLNIGASILCSRSSL